MKPGHVILFLKSTGNILKYLILIILGYILYKMIRPSLLKKPENPHVKGGPGTKKQDQKINKKNIEDADFEDVE